jgi:hypothetical protein
MLQEDLRSFTRQKEYDLDSLKMKLKGLEDDLIFQNERNSSLAEQNKKLQVGITSSSGDKSVIESKLSEL